MNTRVGQCVQWLFRLPINVCEWVNSHWDYFNFPDGWDGTAVLSDPFSSARASAACSTANMSAHNQGEFIGPRGAASNGWRRNLFSIFRSARFFMYRRTILTALLYFLGAKVGFLLTVQPHAVSTVWPPNAILTGMLLLTPRRQWWLIFMAAFPAHLVVQMGHGVPLSMLLCWFVSNSTEAVIGALLIRRFVGSPVQLNSFRSVAWFISVGALLTPFLSSFLDVSFVTLIGWGADNYWQAWRIRSLSNILAMLMVVPVIVSVGRMDGFPKVTWRRFLEGFFLGLGLVSIGIVVFFENKLPIIVAPTIFYLPFLFLLWTAVRFGPGGLSGSVTLTGVLTIAGAIHGLGPFSQMTPTENVFALQIFLIATSVPLMLLSGLIQERQHAVMALDESEMRFRVAADAAPVMVWMTGPDKGCTFVNKGWLEFTGKQLESHLGEGWTKCLHPDDLAANFEIYTTAFDQRVAFRMDYRLRRAHGDYGWVMDQGVPRYSADGTFLGYVGTAIDITARKQIEAALERSEKRFREVVESQPDLVCRYLPDTTLTLVNEAYCRFFGKPREQLIGRSMLQFTPPAEHATILDRIVSSMRAPKTVTFERQLTHANGNERWHQWIVHPIFDNAGHVVEFQASARDVTDWRKAKESLRATHQKINSLARQLVHAEEAERRRIARELHDDFSQKLAAHAVALSNFGQSMISGDVSILSKLEKLQNEAISLSDDIRLIAHELHPPRIEQAGFENTLRTFCDEFSTLTHLEIELDIEIDKTLPADVALCCFRVVQESLRNISKHAHAERVKVLVKLVVGRIVLIVADDGIGVEDQKVKTAHGLGLTSMAERIEFLSGEFHISKRKSGGTLIAVEVPIL
jgi:PAS domain S-box-containing protein